MSVKLCLELTYEVRSSYSQEQEEGWENLSAFYESSKAFFQLIGATIIHKEFWGSTEGDILTTGFVGYETVITFDGKATDMFKFPILAEFFFDIHDAKKTDENLHFVK